MWFWEPHKIFIRLGFLSRVVNSRAIAKCKHQQTNSINEGHQGLQEEWPRTLLSCRSSKRITSSNKEIVQQNKKKNPLEAHLLWDHPHWGSVKLAIYEANVCSALSSAASDSIGQASGQLPVWKMRMSSRQCVTLLQHYWFSILVNIQWSRNCDKCHRDLLKRQQWQTQWLILEHLDHLSWCSTCSHPRIMPLMYCQEPNVIKICHWVKLVEKVMYLIPQCLLMQWERAACILESYSGFKQSQDNFQIQSTAGSAEIPKEEDIPKMKALNKQICLQQWVLGTKCSCYIISRALTYFHCVWKNCWITSYSS